MFSLQGEMGSLILMIYGNVYSLVVCMLISNGDQCEKSAKQKYFEDK